MFDRIANSFALARSSWGVLKTDKKLVLFPVLSGIACVLVLVSFVTPFLIRPDAFANLQDKAPWALALIGFAFYFVNYFVIVFFNAALVSCALIRFHGGEPTLGDGLRASAARLPQILAWALVSATVGMLLKAVENAGERVGQIVSAILGTVWSVMTYFVVPVLVVEKVGPFAAVGRSVAILKKTWGEALVGHFGVGLFVFLLALPGILLLVGAFLVFAAVKSIALGLLLLGLAVLYLPGRERHRGGPERHLRQRPVPLRRAERGAQRLRGRHDAARLRLQVAAPPVPANGRREPAGGNPTPGVGCPPAGLRRPFAGRITFSLFCLPAA